MSNALAAVGVFAGSLYFRTLLFDRVPRVTPSSVHWRLRDDVGSIAFRFTLACCATRSRATSTRS